METVKRRLWGIVVALVLALLVAPARAQTPTPLQVDCGPFDVTATGLYVVVGVAITYDADGVPIFEETTCTTAGGGGAVPITPDDGVVGWCPAQQDGPTVCECSVDVNPSETDSFCLQLDAATFAVVADATLTTSWVP